MYRLSRTTLVFLFLLLPALASAYKGEVVRGTVMQVKDGDTVVISPVDGGQFFVCRLYGIDTPETPKKGKPGQDFGEEAERAMKDLVLGQAVDVMLTGAKTYKREVCLITKDGKDVNLEMVRLGYAWAYRQYLKRPYKSEYMAAEEEARSRGLGIWQEVNPVPPWEFRKRKPSVAKADSTETALASLIDAPGKKVGKAAAVELKKVAATMTLLASVQNGVGKTFIQKGVYILQEGLGEDLGYSYKLYLHGPYSHALDRDMDILRKLDLITVKNGKEGQGYDISLTAKGRDFLRTNLSGYKADDKRISKILSLIGDEPVRKMELIGTVLYFSKKTKNVSEIKRLVNTVKPQFSDEDIDEAVRVLRENRIIRS